MRTVVFINSHSRQAAQNAAFVKKFFSRQDSPFKVLEYIVINDLADFDACLHQLQSHKDIECVIIGSGDGTIIAALNKLKKRKNIVYGFIPLGTSNTFVRSLGLPIDFKKALHVITQNHVRYASLGSINGTLFANIADIGVPVQVADKLTDRVKKHFGSFAYAISGIRELVRHDAVWCEVTIDGKRESFYTHQLFIANGKYRGPVAVSKDTSVYSDTLTLGYSDSLSRWEYLKDAFGFLTGKTEKRKSLIFLSVKKVTIRTKPAQMIQADGEVIGKTPAKITVIEKAIRVLTPSETPDLPRRKRKNRR